MTQVTPAARVPLTNRRRVIAATAAVITALFGSSLAAFVLAQPSGATTVPQAISDGQGLRSSALDGETPVLTQRNPIALVARPGRRLRNTE